MIDWSFPPPLPERNMLPAHTDSGADTWWRYAGNGEAAWVGKAPGGDRLQLDWDGLGRLKSVSDGSARHDYAYAPSCLRVRDKRTGASPRDRRFAYASGGALLTVYETPAVPAPARRDIVYANGGAIAEIDAAGNIFELHCDHLGSPRHITSGSTGAVVGEQAFGPYGERMVGTFNGKVFPSGYRPVTGWTGHIDEDPTGLIYMRGRRPAPPTTPTKNDAGGKKYLRIGFPL